MGFEDTPRAVRREESRQKLTKGDSGKADMGEAAPGPRFEPFISSQWLSFVPVPTGSQGTQR